MNDVMIKNGRSICIIDAVQWHEQWWYFKQAIEEKTIPILLHKEMKNKDRSEFIEYIKTHDLPSPVDFGVLSSGTSGQPKVLWRQKESWLSFFPIQNEAFHIDEKTVLFFHGSLSFTGNLNMIWAVEAAGGKVVTARTASPKEWLQVMKEYKVTHVYLLPTKLRLLLKAMKEVLPSWQYVICGSQMIDTKLVEDFKQLVPHGEGYLYYGASELNYISYCTFHEWLTHPNTVGRAFPNVNISIEDGYIYVDTPYSIEGISMPCTLHDMGHMDEDNFLYFYGRNTEMINRGGYKIWLPSMEKKVKSLPLVFEAVALPLKDEKRGETYGLVVVPQSYAKAEEVFELPIDGNIMEGIRRLLLPVERPKKILFLSRIPLKSTSKVDISRLNEYFTED